MPFFVLPHTNGATIWLRGGRPGLEPVPETEPAQPASDADPAPRQKVKLKGKRKAE